MPDTHPRLRAWRTTALCALAALCLLATLLVALALSPSLAERLLWRIEPWQPRPTLSQRLYERRLLNHQLAQDQRLAPGALLFFGDSHLQALPLGRWPAAHNFGIGGESTERLAQRLPRFASLAQARTLVLSSGSNDLLEGRTAQAAAASWRKVLDAVPAGVPVLCLETPVNPQRPAQAEAQRALNAVVAGLCRQRHHPVLSGALFDGDQHFAADGLHLNAAGSLRWLEHIHRALENRP